MQEHYFCCARFNQSEMRMGCSCMEVPFQKGTRTTSPAYITEPRSNLYDNSNVTGVHRDSAAGELLLFVLLFVDTDTLTTHRKLREMGVQNGHLLTHGEIYGLLGRLLRKVIFALLLSVRTPKCDVSVNTIKNNLQTF